MGLFNWFKKIKQYDPYWNELSNKEKKLMMGIVSDPSFNKDIEEFKKRNPKEYEKIIKEFDAEMESKYGLIRKKGFEDLKKTKK